MNMRLSYYHPSTVIFVDDQQAFLTAIKNRLPQQMMALFFNDATSALKKIIMEKLPQNTNLQALSEVDDFFEIEHQSNNETFLSLKLGEVCKTIYNANRFAEISVVIVDRIMPSLDGMDFCRKLIDHPIKKIMLTASKDRKVATEAFNEGIIDFFLLKDSPNLISQLCTAIKAMQKDYFQSLTKQTFGSTLALAVPAINNDSIAHFLRNKMEELNAVEFYLLDKWGSMLFVTYDGTPTTLAILPENIMNTYASIAQEHEEESIAEILISREKLLFFPQTTDCMCPVTSWSNFLFEANPFPDQSNLFYSVIRSPHHQPVHIERVCSQKLYMI